MFKPLNLSISICSRTVFASFSKIYYCANGIKKNDPPADLTVCKAGTIKKRLHIVHCEEAKQSHYETL